MTAQSRSVNRLILEFQSDARAIEEGPVPVTARLTLYAVLALVVIAIAWAALSLVDQVVVARGKLITGVSGGVVQPLETSIVRSIDVKAGDIVRKGDRLGTLDQTFTEADAEQLKSRIDSLGAQVLDLEELAAHRGSILGNLPDVPQPSQKTFESRVWSKLHGFVPQQPVYVEAESKKIGRVRVPDALLAAMWAGRCIRLEPDPALRVGLLKEEYRHFLEAPEGLAKKLDFLAGLHGRELVGKWQSMAQSGQWDQLVAELLERHYDPAYGKSTLKHYPNHADGLLVRPADLSSGAMLELARWLMTPSAGASGAPLDAAGKSASL